MKRRRSSRGVRADAAVLLTRRVASRELIAARCAVAADAGISIGMDLSHARSLLPPKLAPHTEPSRPDRDAAALLALARRALRFTPLCAPHPPDGLVLDVTGTEHLHRSEDQLLHHIAADMTRLGLACRLCIAPTIGAAWAMSRFGRHALSSIAPGHQRDALADSPIAALRVAPTIVEGLAEVGVRRIADLIALPRAAIASRFDNELLCRWRQALGEAPETFDPVRPKPLIRCELLFDGPTDQPESIESATRRVVAMLAAELARQDLGVRLLDMDWLRPRAQPTRESIALSRPSSAERHLWSLVRTRLERLDLSEGVDGVRATATRAARLKYAPAASLIPSPDAPAGSDQAHAEPTHSEPAQLEPVWGEFIDTLITRFGPESVLAVDPVESHLPERACVLRSVMERAPARPCAIVPADRPCILLPRPEPIEVISHTPDGPVIRVRWRGTWWDVAASRGPECIGQEWWRWRPIAETRSAKAPHQTASPAPPPPGDREYFTLQLAQGRRLWVFRYAAVSHDGSACPAASASAVSGWFLHGEWC